MSDFPGVRLDAAPIMGWWAPGAMGARLDSVIPLPSPTAGVSAVYTINRAYIFPFRLYETQKPLKMLWIVGATANGNIDAGIYDSERNRLCSTGAVAQGTINTAQVASLTTTPELLPGDYFMAISGSSASGTLFRVGVSTDEQAVQGIMKYQMTSAHPLPATITLTKDTDLTPILPLLAIAFHTFY
jgi:hypothetical protein